jgi:TetR/AcrR family transcriptional repressor of lmrAB and yxaGH operons
MQPRGEIVSQKSVRLPENPGDDGGSAADTDARSTRQIIVDTTSRLLETQGYHGTGLNQIIKESGAPRGSLYYYFPEGKEELAAEAILERARGLSANSRMLLAQGEDPAAAVRRFFDGLIAYFESAQYCGGAPLAAVALETAGSNERLRQACATAYDLLLAPFTETFEAGGFSPERAHALSTLVNAAIEGGVVLARAQHSTEPLRRVRDELLHLIACA